MEGCPEEENLTSLLAGRLAAGGREQLARHTEGCPDCQRVLGRLSLRLTMAGSLPAALVGGDARPGGTDPIARGQHLGRYVVLDTAGTGAMGAVYAAYDTLLDRKVALKLLSGSTPTEGALVEGAAMARLAHPNVVRVHDVGVLDGVPYLSMELVEGTTLDAWCRQQPRSFRDIARVMASAARGLGAAHAVGLVHRDVKPQNILVAGSRVLVTDFGVSMRADGQAAEQGGGPAGTPAYMAPEQLRGEPVDGRADVYGLCATLYEALHGSLPHPGPTLDQLKQQAAQGVAIKPPPGSRAPAWLHRLALAGLNPDPARRPADMDRVADQLLVDPARRRRTLVLAAAGLAAVAGAFGGGRYLAANPERQCRSGGEAAMAAVWNPPRREQLGGRYAQAGRVSSWPVLSARLDQYAREWRAMYAQTCAATYGERAQSDRVFDQRVRCLEGRRSGLQALLTAMSSASPGQLVQAAGAVPAAISDCDGRGPMDSEPLPADPAARAQIAAVEDALGQSQAAQNLGDYPRAATAANRAVDGARGVGHGPLLAAALVRLGEVELRAGGSRVDDKEAGLVKASKFLEEAYAAAERGHDDRQRLAASRNQIAVKVALGEYDQAQLWLGLARALLARIGTPAADASLLALNVASFYNHRGEDEAAAGPYQQALEHARRTVPPDDRLLALASAGVCSTTGSLDQQIACFRKTEPLFTRAFGPEHPELGNFYGRMSVALEQKKDSRAEACRLRRRALDLWEKNLDPSHPDIVVGLINLSICLMDDDALDQARATLDQALARNPRPQHRGHVHEAYGYLLGYRYDQTDAAVTHYRASIQNYEAAFGPTQDNPIRLRRNFASMLSRAGRPEHAERELDGALAVLRSGGITLSKLVAEIETERAWVMERASKYQPAVDSFQEALRLHKQLKTPEQQLAYEEHGLGHVLMRLRRFDQALPHLEKALALRPEGQGLNPGLRAFAASSLGEALVETGKRERGCALGTEAASILTGRRLPETQRWMARLDCPRVASARR